MGLNFLQIFTNSIVIIVALQINDQVDYRPNNSAAKPLEASFHIFLHVFKINELTIQNARYD